MVKNLDYTNYEEGIYVGYRHFDKAGLDVSYPFGFGLSYTKFSYSDVEVNVQDDTIHVALTVENIGEIAGKEVAQIYASKINTSIDRPDQELKAFAKTKELQPGERQQLHMSFLVSELGYWDEDNAGWAFENGIYEVRIGASSRDIKLQSEIEL